MGKRKRCLGIILSTQAEDDEHPLSQLIDDGLAGNDPALVVDLTCAPPDADVFDQDVIRAANPALGVFLDPETLFKEAEQAKRLPSAESAFRNLRCNQRVMATPPTCCARPRSGTRATARSTTRSSPTAGRCMAGSTCRRGSISPRWCWRPRMTRSGFICCRSPGRRKKP